MARPKTETLTPLELEIMKVLWELGPSNVQAVQESLERDLAYTSVQTMLNILCRKDKVKRVLQERAYVYQPVVSRTEVLRQSVGDMLQRLFGGSAESLVMSLVETKQITPAQLRRLNRLVNQPKKGKDHERD